MIELGYYNGEFKPLSEITISPEDRGFLFGDGVYEVVRVHNGRCFALSYHEDRLYRSMRKLDIPVRIPPDELSELHEILIEQSGINNGSIYLQITRGSGPRSHSYYKKNYEPNVFMYIKPYAETYDEAHKGVKAISLPDERWENCDVKSVNLIPNIMAATKANKKGAHSAVLFRNGICTECDSSNFFVVKGGIIYTHPADNHILKGIMRQLILTRVAPTCGITVIEREFDKAFVEDGDELFLLASVSSIVPILELDGNVVANGEIGPVTAKLQEAYAHLLEEGLA